MTGVAPVRVVDIDGVGGVRGVGGGGGGVGGRRHHGRALGDAGGQVNAVTLNIWRHSYFIHLPSLN